MNRHRAPPAAIHANWVFRDTILAPLLSVATALALSGPGRFSLDHVFGIRVPWWLTGLTLVVTLEPCAMCAGAISHARIGRLVFGAEDPKGGAVVHGPRFFEQPTCHSRPTITGGVLADESSALLKGFFQERRQR